MKLIPDSVVRKVAMAGLQTQQASPTLLFGAGVVGVIGTVILASKATLKLEEVVDDVAHKLDEVNTLVHSDRHEYAEKEAQKDKVVVYTHAVLEIGKLYGPAIILGAVSISCLAGSHRILTKRNAALAAAYTALEKGFEEYRARVVSELGEDKDREFRYGTTKLTVENEETGKKKQVTVVGDGVPTVYARLFDETNPNWQKNDPELNRIFLEAQQRYANERLRRKGHILLNDVYEALGFPRTPAGCVVGWAWNSERGDNYVDFGFGTWPAAVDYIEAREFGVMLDFNVDGLMYKEVS